jgi:uncharacterized protein YciI
MRWEIKITRNAISVSEERVIVEAESKEEAMVKAKRGEYEDIEIIECSDVAELSSEFSEPEKLY